MLTEVWHRNLAALWVGQMLSMLSFSFFFPFIPLYVQTLGVPDTADAALWAGAIAAGTAVTMAIVQPVWGSVADRWGRKPMVIRSMVGNSVITILMGFATSPEQLLALRLIQGAVTGTFVATNTLVSTSTPRHRVGFALGMMQMSVFFGNSVGPLVGGLIADSIGFRAAFFAAGLLMAVPIPLVMRFVREDFSPPQTKVSLRGAWAESGSLLSMALIPTVIGLMFMIQFGLIIIMPVLSLFVAELSGGENAATAAGGIIALTGVLSAFAAMGIGRLGDRIGYKLPLVICLVGAAVVYFPQAFVRDVWELLVLRSLLGIFLGGLMPSANALLTGIVPEGRRGAAFGLAASSYALANAVGPLIGAGIVMQWGMRAVFLATGAFYALGCLWVGFGFRKYGHARPRQGVGTVESQPDPH